MGINLRLIFLVLCPGRREEPGGAPTGDSIALPVLPASIFQKEAYARFGEPRPCFKQQMHSLKTMCKWNLSKADLSSPVTYMLLILISDDKTQRVFSHEMCTTEKSTNKEIKITCNLITQR